MALGDDLDRLYDDCIPPDLGADFLRLLSKHFADTPDFVEAYWHAAEARDLLGHIRRANFEQDWRSLGERTVGVVALAETNPRGTSSYTVFTAGRLVLTSSCVETPSSLPRPAEFRRRNAEQRQLEIFRPASIVLNEVYGILTYGGVGRKLTFAQIGFPDASCEAWLHRIDLRSKYPDVWGDLNPEGARPVQPEAPVKLLRQDDKA